MVAPGSLVEQWQDELGKKFNLEFDILTRDMLESSRSGNPFSDRDRLIVRLDVLARNEELQTSSWALASGVSLSAMKPIAMSATYSARGQIYAALSVGQKLGPCMPTSAPHVGDPAQRQRRGFSSSSRRCSTGSLDGGRFRDGVHYSTPRT